MLCFLLRWRLITQIGRRYCKLLHIYIFCIMGRKYNISNFPLSLLFHLNLLFLLNLLFPLKLFHLKYIKYENKQVLNSSLKKCNNFTRFPVAEGSTVKQGRSTEH